jgi:hypothetical protein
VNADRNATVLTAVEDFRNGLRSQSKRRTLRQRLRDFFQRVADRLDDALDVFDD